MARGIRIGFGQGPLALIASTGKFAMMAPAAGLSSSAPGPLNITAAAGFFTLTGKAATLTGSGVPGIVQNVRLTQQAGPSNNLSNSQKIQWDAVAGATGYNVYRSVNSGSGFGAPSLYAQPGNVTSYTDSAATGSNILTYDSPSTAYYYQVSATNAAGEGVLSTQYVVYEYTSGASTCGNSIFNY